MADADFSDSGYYRRVQEYCHCDQEKQRLLADVKKDGSTLIIQNRLVKFITYTNWILFFAACAVGYGFAPPAFAKGILFGGLIVTINFHLLARTLKSALTPPHLAPVRVVIGKYYIRFIISGFIIFLLMAWHIVDPLGLIIGLSVVVVSIMIATVLELKKLILKEAL